LQAAHRLQSELGAQVALLQPDELAARFPWLNTQGLVLGSLGTSGEGWLDPHAVLHGFRRKAAAQGVRFLRDEAMGLLREGGRIAGVSLREGGRLEAGTTVLCAGWRSGALAAGAGIGLPVGPKKRMTYVFDCRTPLADMPLTIDITGVATRPEGAQHLGIVSPPEDEDSDCPDLELDHHWFEEVIWPALAHRIPAFEAIKPTGAWAGHYDVNRFDHNAVLGGHPELDGILFCTGFSGHGIQQSPAAGRATAELIVHGRYVSLDLSALDYRRIPEARPIREDAVV
jgi:sarcosine oxidase